MSSDESSLTLDEVNQALENIENQYSPNKKRDAKNEIEEELLILSEELEMVGLPVLNIAKPTNSILKDVIESSRSLFHLHRRNLSKITDVELDNESKNRRIADLHKVIDDYKLKVKKRDNKSSNLQNQLTILKNENTALTKKETMLKEEMDTVKRYHTSKYNELMHQYKKVIREFQHLKKIFDKGLPTSKDDVLMQMLGNYRKNEEIYKSTIQKLQENNQNLIEEILQLKETDLSNLSVKTLTK